jgi:glycosyltransferase involved in cell wall biosynthesis
VKNILLVGNWSSDVGYAWWLMEEFWVAISKKYAGERKVYLSYPEVGDLSPIIAKSDIEVIKFDFTSRNWLKTLIMVRKLSIDTIYLTDRSYLSAFYILLYLSGVRNIVIHDHAPGERTVPRGMKKVIKFLAARIPLLTGTKYIAVSEFVLNRLKSVALLPVRKCHLAMNGVNIDLLDSFPSLDMQKELGLPAGSLVVVSCSRASFYKGIQHILGAAEILLREPGYEHVFFLHCGDGPDLAELERRRDLELKDRFIFLGARADVPRILKSCDIAVHASSGEGLSLSILEFMAASLPVVVSDSPSVCQSINDGVSGLHFNVNDTLDLVSKLKKLIDSGRMRAQMGAEARNCVVAQYSLKKTIADVLLVFDGI